MKKAAKIVLLARQDLKLNTCLDKKKIYMN